MLLISAGSARMVCPRGINSRMFRINGPHVSSETSLLYRPRSLNICSGFNTCSKRSKNVPTGRPNASSASGEASAIISPPTADAPLPIWQRLGYLSAFFRFYAKSQAKRPYVTQFVSSLAIFCAGDLGAQWIGGDEYDSKRTLRVLAISAGSSVIAFRWLLFIGRSFNYSSKILSLGTKVFVNQLVYAPVFGSYYFTMQSLLSGDSVAQTWNRVRTALPVSIKNSWMFWPPITGMTFAFIPPAYQAVVLAAVATCWQTYLSYLNRATDKITAARQTES